MLHACQCFWNWWRGISCSCHAGPHPTSKCVSGHNIRAISTSQVLKIIRRCCALYIFTWKCASAARACIFWTCQFLKEARSGGVLHNLTWKCGSLRNSVHIFQHLIFQTCSCIGVVCRFWGWNVFRAGTACNFFGPSSGQVAPHLAL